MCAPNAEMPDSMAMMASSQIPPMAKLTRARIGVAIVKTAGKLFVRLVDTCRSQQIGRSDNEPAIGRDVVVIQDVTQLVAQRCFRSRFEGEAGWNGPVGAFRDDVSDIDQRRIGLPFPSTRVQAPLRRPQLQSQRVHRRPARLERPTQDAERFPIALLDNGGVRSAVAALGDAVTARQMHVIFRQKRRQGCEKSARAECRGRRRARRGLRCRIASP